MQVIKVLGLASGRIIELVPQNLDENLLNWLRSEGVTVASSCDGEGVCKKCTIQNDWLTCELTIASFLNRQPDGIIKISYL